MLIQLVRFSAGRSPIQHQVGCRYQFHAHDVTINRIFSRTKWLSPNTLLSLAYNITMPEFNTTQVLSFFSNIGYDNTNITDGDLRHLDLFNFHKPGIQVIRSSKNNLWLQTLVTIIYEETIRILAVVMSFNILSGNSTFIKWHTIQSGDNTHHVVLNFCEVSDHHIKQESVDTI